MITFITNPCVICKSNTFDKKKDVCSKECGRIRVRKKYNTY